MADPRPPVQDPDPVAVVTLALAFLCVLTGLVVALDQESMAPIALGAIFGAAVFVIGLAVSVIAKHRR